ncbi:alpha-E domain-containing protein [Comamonas aquatica]|jgi:hypothetical protein|uniref:Alpha-E domain-containing protein n=1 Tax=Comamonas aquatica TaxID=225991 RepID=A0AA42HYE7_9BURK|nr:alpha-E domain-containing protein [Comamonas aquatica]MDH0363952.1 alpha-E domain-containing protein [Comamonas aquatica]
MLSRTADHRFWGSPDTERADKRCALATAPACAAGAGFSAWGEIMLSRTADHLFWMSRDTERADKRCALATQQRPPAQQARGFLPGEESC